jgi:hypothetical protein
MISIVSYPRGLSPGLGLGKVPVLEENVSLLGCRREDVARTWHGTAAPWARFLSLAVVSVDSSSERGAATTTTYKKPLPSMHHRRLVPAALVLLLLPRTHTAQFF